MLWAEFEFREREWGTGESGLGEATIWEATIWMHIIACWVRSFLVTKLTNMHVCFLLSFNLFPVKEHLLGKKALDKISRHKRTLRSGEARFRQSSESAGDGRNVTTSTPCWKIKDLPVNQNFPLLLMRWQSRTLGLLLRERLPAGLRLLKSSAFNLRRLPGGWRRVDRARDWDYSPPQEGCVPY